MEVFFLTRGKSDEVDELKKWLSTRHLPLPITKADGTTEQRLMECQLRPIQLWGFVFPKEYQDTIFNTLNLPSGNPSFVVNGKPTFNMDKKIWALRKMLGAKPIPKLEDRKDKISTLFMPFDRIKHVNIVGIGIREDGEIADTTHERI